MSGFHEALYASIRAAHDLDSAVRFELIDLAPPEAADIRQGAALSLPGATLTALASLATERLAFGLRRSFLSSLEAVALDERADGRDRFTARELLRNAAVSGEGVFPLCQDTGTASVFGWKGDRFFVDSSDDDSVLLERGMVSEWATRKLRFSQVAPLSMFEERNTGTNAPVPCEIFSRKGLEYHLLFVAKGGGSSNKTALFQETKAILEPVRFGEFISRAVRSLGVSACPPYRIAVVVGGQSPEECVFAAKMATTGALDALPANASGDGMPYRDREWEGLVVEAARATGLGAQFGGAFLAWDARVVRMARHAASLPVAVAVSCAAHRQLLARMDARGVWLETIPAYRLPAGLNGAPLPVYAIPPVATGPAADGMPDSERVPINLDEGDGVLELLRAGDRVTLSGSVVLARDAAHLRLSGLLHSGVSAPGWTRLPVFYASPTGTPEGARIGSIGPTTSKRMDPYLEEFMSKGIFRVMIGKGERTEACRQACARHDGVYFVTTGGAAALAATHYVEDSRVADWEDLGMEAIRIVQLKGLPAMVAVDSKGRDHFQELRG